VRNVKIAAFAGIKKIRTISSLIAATLLAAAIGTVWFRSATGFSHFSRIDYCSLCGVEQSYREICILDRRVFQSTSHFDNGVSRVLRKGKADCGHNFRSVRQRMIHVSARTTPSVIKREYGTDFGADVFSHEIYIAALAAIHATDPESSRLIWSRTIRQSIENGMPLDQLRSVLEERNTDEVKSFLTTNPSFRPARPNPERWFR